MPTSVMPKGVEHNQVAGDELDFGNMPTSVMPKGVEHMRNPRSRPGPCYAHLCDAERR